MLVRWLKRQFNGNPLVEDPKPYLLKVREALKVGMWGVVGCILFMIIGSFIFVLGTIYGWF